MAAAEPLTVSPLLWPSLFLPITNTSILFPRWTTGTFFDVPFPSSLTSSPLSIIGKSTNSCWGPTACPGQSLGLQRHTKSGEALVFEALTVRWELVSRTQGNGLALLPPVTSLTPVPLAASCIWVPHLQWLPNSPLRFQGLLIAIHYSQGSRMILLKSRVLLLRDFAELQSGLKDSLSCSLLTLQNTDSFFNLRVKAGT